MNFLLITEYWKKSPGGGVRVYSERLVNELIKMGISVNVLYEEGYDPEQIQMPQNKFLLSLFSVLKIKRLPDLIFTTSNWRNLIRGIILKFFYKCKLFSIVHSPIENLPKFFYIFWTLLINQSDEIIFVSNYLKKSYLNSCNLKRGKCIVIYAGVEKKKTSKVELDTFKHKYKINDDSIILLAQGLTSVLVKANGLKLIIKSINNLKEKYPNIILIATGDGKYKDEINELIKKENLQDNIILTGYVENSFIPLELCNIYIHVVFNEGLSLSILEAMSLGKPIIASNLGGIPEVINEGYNGILVSPDIKQISDKISFLIENKSIAETFGKNAKKSSSNYTWKKTVIEILNLYYQSHLT